MALEQGFNSATQVDWELACERETVIRPLAQAVRLESWQVADAANAIGLGRSATYRLIALFKRRPKTSTLLPAKSGRRHSTRWLDPRVEAIVEQTIQKFYHRTRVLARQLEVRMLVIDEIHSMLAGTFREQRIFLNSLRFLANDLRIPLVCLGTHEAKQALMTDQQLADRFDAFELPAWRDDAALGKLLTSYASLLPLRESSELCAPKLRKRLLSLTEGVTVRICRLLERPLVRAIESGRERIEADLLNEELLTHSLVSISDRHVRRPSV